MIEKREAFWKKQQETEVIKRQVEEKKKQR